MDSNRVAPHERTIGKDLDLAAEQEATLLTPVMSANIILKAMYIGMDLVYGKRRTLAKFKVIELLARYPYWAWENGSYQRVTRRYAKTAATTSEDMQRDLRHIEMGRIAQDNEQWHLALIEDIMRRRGMKQNWVMAFLVPRCMAITYLILTRVLYRLKPEWSFSMNARFESHAEHEYMHLVEEHPEWDEEPVESDYFKYYPEQRTMGDLFRRIGLDERDHMNESMEEYQRLTGRSLA